jgi:hypothetical protein
MEADKIFKRFKLRMDGHIRYYGVSENDLVEKFLWEGLRILFKWLNRRSQRKSMTWERFNEIRRIAGESKYKVWVNLYA